MWEDLGHVDDLGLVGEPGSGPVVEHEYFFRRNYRLVLWKEENAGLEKPLIDVTMLSAAPNAYVRLTGLRRR